jgi:uncharacterized protein YjiS (DUF1127 family)
MSRLYDERTTPLFTGNNDAGLPGLGIFGALFRGIVRPIRAMYEARKAYLELMALDDRQLADIGLRRGEIELALTGRLHRDEVKKAAEAAATGSFPLRRAA